MNSLTPIEQYKDILLKRDDKFTMDKVNGGKLRQVLALIKKDSSKIKENYNNSVVGAYGISSTFPPIIARVCKEFDIQFNLLTFKSQNSSSIGLAQEYGATIYGFDVGYPKVLHSISNTYSFLPS